MFIFFSRVLKFAWQNFWRNLGLSLITILILITTLVSVDTVYLVRGITETAVRLVEERIDISLNFKTNAPEEKIAEIQKTLQAEPKVKNIIFKNKEKVLEEFKIKHKNDKEVLDALEELGSNPLGAVLVIKARNAADYEEIIKTIDLPEFNSLIEEKTFDDHGPVIKKIGIFTNRVEQGGILLGLVLTIVAFLTIFNVIRLSIIMHGEEIGIMKLVGATNWFVRLPFLVEIFFLIVVAWLINLGIVYGAVSLLDPVLVKFFEGSGFSLRGYFVQNFALFFGAELLGLIFLGFVSSSLAMRKYLKT